MIRRVTVRGHYIFINSLNPSQYFFGSICFQKLEEKRKVVLYKLCHFLTCQNKTIIDRLLQISTGGESQRLNYLQMSTCKSTVTVGVALN